MFLMERWAFNQHGVRQGTLPELQTLAAVCGVGGGEDLRAQVVGFEHMAKAKDGAQYELFDRVQAGKLMNIDVSYNVSSIAGEDTLNTVARSRRSASVNMGNGGPSPLVPSAGVCSANSALNSPHGTTNAPEANFLQRNQ